MSTYDAIRDAARAFEREFVRSDPALPAPATLATLAQELTALIGSLPGAVSGVNVGARINPSEPFSGLGAPAQLAPLGHSASQAAQNAAYSAAAAAAHLAAVDAAAADVAAQQAVAAATTTTTTA
jgi:hypothetical protein